jgi:hypothetical protein
MKFLWRYIWNRMREIGNERDECAKPIAVSSVDRNWHDNLTIHLTTAVGGKIVTFKHYDIKNDRANTKTYVIPDELDFGSELAKLITLESMRC